MSLVLLTAPTEEPLSLTDAKLHLRIDDSTAEDALVTTLIQASRDYVERQTGRALLPQQWAYTLDSFPCVIRIRRAPLISIDSITYVDPNGATQTLASDQYEVDLVSPFGEIRPAYGVVWPYTRVQRNAVTVTFTAGYADAESVPSGLRAAMLLMLGELYMNREASIVGTIITSNPAIHALMSPYVLPVV